ncbi:MULTISPECIES: response regulator [Persicobacter]|uniref:Response regulator n=1 Tax=Persicobacter diffluens TaxID=981 RepID=A0AAN4VYP6_9BACT|nr:response regulator [Persicobacter sp. CCB-QB2]GJM61245.1 response regulator [Persicobacter diffluens]
MAIFERIMIVDDDVVSNYICERTLDRSNYAKEVLTFSLPEKALGHLNNIVKKGLWQELPQVLFLDLQMPKVNGWQFLSRLKEIDQEIAQKIFIVMFSSSIFSEDMEQARNHPMIQQYHAKPLKAEMLEEIQQQAVGMFE